MRMLLAERFDQSKIELENGDLGSTEPLPPLSKALKGVNGRNSDKTLIRRNRARHCAPAWKDLPVALRPVPSARKRRTRRCGRGYGAKAGIVLVSAAIDTK